jgi:hypothetical protein
MRSFSILFFNGIALPFKMEFSVRALIDKKQRIILHDEMVTLFAV